jgi:hypothetical protein
VLLAVLVCLAVAGWRWGPPAWKHGQFLYWQRQCLAYAAPVDQVVYENDPERAAKLLRQPGYVNVAPQGAPPVAVHMPRCWSEAMNIGGVPVVNTGFGAGGPGATLFLHERTTASGVRRLVAVQVPVGTPGVAGLPIPAPVVVQPATLRAAPAVRSAAAKIDLDLVFNYPSSGSFTLLSGPSGTTARFFAGQADAADLSHFTIPFECGASRGTIEGWLKDDGDLLSLAVNGKPAANPDGEKGYTQVTGSVTAPTTQPATASLQISRPRRMPYVVSGQITINASNITISGATIGAGNTSGAKVNRAVRFDSVSIKSLPPPTAAPVTRPSRTTRPSD